jgi:hypothetical protein
MNKPIQGYVRSNVPLQILATAVHKSTSDPSVGHVRDFDGRWCPPSCDHSGCGPRSAGRFEPVHR